MATHGSIINKQNSQIIAQLRQRVFEKGTLIRSKIRRFLQCTYLSKSHENDWGVTIETIKSESHSEFSNMPLSTLKKSSEIFCEFILFSLGFCYLGVFTQNVPLKSHFGSGFFQTFPMFLFHIFCLGYWGVRGAECKILKLFDKNLWKNNLLKLATFDFTAAP